MRRSRFSSWLLSGVLLAAGSASGQEPSTQVTARFERDTVSVGQEALLILEITGESATDSELMPFPKIPGLAFRAISGPNFSIRSASTGTGLGDLHIATYQVGVRALAAGEYDIRDLSVLCQSDMAVLANPVFLRAVSADADAAPIALWIEAEPQQVYARQPFQVRVRLEVDTRVSPQLTSANARFHFPFWTNVVSLEQETALRPFQKRFPLVDGNCSLLLDSGPDRVRRDGVFYDVLSCTAVVLAPEPATLSLAGSRFDVDSGEIGSAIAEPRSVQVLPLPVVGRPAGFADAVGDFTFQASADRKSVTVGDTVSVTLSLRETREKSTNIRYLRLGPYEEVEGFRLFQQTADQAPGLRTIRLDLSPATARVSQIPSFEFAWFDPLDQEYHVARTPPIPLQVRPHPEGKELVDEPEEAGRNSFFRKSPFYLTAVLLFALLLRAIVRRRPVRAGEAKSKGEEARPGFERGLERLQKEGDADPVAEARLLARYLADRFDSEPGRCFGKESAAVLLQHGVDPALAEDVARYFAQVEASAFHGATDPERPDPGAQELVERLDPPKIHTR
ncbi:MAG: hypothetical protein V2A76_12005 [Planctomycetota bacterium]